MSTRSYIIVKRRKEQKQKQKKQKQMKQKKPKRLSKAEPETEVKIKTKRASTTTEYVRAFCRCDGGIDRLGATLRADYNSQELAEKLVLGGDMHFPGDGEERGTCGVYTNILDALSDVSFNIEFIYLWNGTEWKVRCLTFMPRKMVVDPTTKKKSFVEADVHSPKGLNVWSDH